MNFDRPKSLGTSIEVRTESRPIKVVYLVPTDDSPVTHMMLDAVYYESYTRWAGAHTLVIPTKANEFTDIAYEEWLAFFDPDIVYTYVSLNKDWVDKIDALCSPIQFLHHQTKKRSADADRWQDYLATWRRDISPISSITTIASPKPIRIFPDSPETEPVVTVLTQYSGDVQNRVLSDNFGTAFDLSNVTYAIPGLLKTLCLVPPNLPVHTYAGEERCHSIADCFSALVSRKAFPISKFAFAHSEAISRAEPYEWAHCLNLFIGESVADRVHFWNARHFSPDYAAIPNALILSKDFFADPNLVALLGKYLNENNFLGQGNGQYQVTIRSQSYCEDELCTIRDQLGKHTYNAVILGGTLKAFSIPTKEDLENRFGRISNATKIKVSETSSVLSAHEPAHFFYISPRLKEKIAGGQWMVELDIQRHNNLSRFSNIVENWTLPRRAKIVPAFTGRIGKITRSGKLAIVPGPQRAGLQTDSVQGSNQFELFLPSDEQFFEHLALDFFEFSQNDLRSSIAAESYKDLAISDKGQNLRGVISMFDSLNQAYEILTNKFWRGVLREGKEDAVKQLAYTRKKLDGFLPSDRQEREKLMKELSLPDIGVVNKFMASNLSDTLEYLVRVKVFFQVHHWRCKYCGHTNSRNFDSMKISNNCDICETAYYAPIDLDWSFELNDFVYRSLAKHTGLPVLWTLGHLQEFKGRNSFWYLTEVDLFEKQDDSDNKSEIDILCVVDGAYCAVEVKSSVSLFVKKPGEKEKFIKKISRLRPDVAILCFERLSEEGINAEEMRQALSIACNQIKMQIDSKITLEIIIANDHDSFTKHPASLGRFGHRSQSHD